MANNYITAANASSTVPCSNLNPALINFLSLIHIWSNNELTPEHDSVTGTDGTGLGRRFNRALGCHRLLKASICGARFRNAASSGTKNADSAFRFAFLCCPVVSLCSPTVYPTPTQWKELRMPNACARSPVSYTHLRANEARVHLLFRIGRSTHSVSWGPWVAVRMVSGVSTVRLRR